MVRPESTISAEEALIWNLQSWGKKVPADVVPSVAKIQMARTAPHDQLRKPLGPRPHQRPAVHVLQRRRLQRVGKTSGASGTASRRATPRRCAASRRSNARCPTSSSAPTGARTRPPCRPACSRAASHARPRAMDDRQPQRIRDRRRTDRTSSTRRAAATTTCGTVSHSIRALWTIGQCLRVPARRRTASARVLALDANVPHEEITALLDRMRERATHAAASRCRTRGSRNSARTRRDRAHRAGRESARRHDRDSGRRLRLRRQRHRDRRPDLGRPRRAVSVGVDRAAQPSPAHDAIAPFHIDRTPVTNAVSSIASSPRPTTARATRTTSCATGRTARRRRAGTTSR